MHVLTYTLTTFLTFFQIYILHNRLSIFNVNKKLCTQEFIALEIYLLVSATSATIRTKYWI